MNVRFVLLVLANVFAAFACRWSSAGGPAAPLPVASFFVFRPDRHAPLATPQRLAVTHVTLNVISSFARTTISWVHWMLSNCAMHALCGNIDVWSQFLRLAKKGAGIDKGEKWKIWSENRGVLKTFPTFIAGKPETELAKDKQIFGNTYAEVINDMAVLWSNVSSFACAHFLRVFNTMSVEELSRLSGLPLKLDDVLDRIIRFHYSILAHGKLQDQEHRPVGGC